MLGMQREIYLPAGRYCRPAPNPLFARRDSSAGRRSAAFVVGSRSGRDDHPSLPRQRQCGPGDVPGAGSDAARSPGWPCIHVFAAWQAWKYSSSVEYEGTLILVVTPAGEIATTPGAAAAAVVTVLDGEVDAVGAFVPVAEQPIVADAAARTATVPHVRGRDGRDRTWSIYATLATVTQRARYWECCRP
jgi:hypothetical protein